MTMNFRSAPGPRTRAAIANLGPHEFFFSRSYRQFHILPCAKGQQYGLTIIEDCDGTVDMGDDQYFTYPIAARAIAEDLVQAENLAVWGVFVCAGMRPTPAEIAAAEKIVREYSLKKLHEGDELWSKYHRHELIDDNCKRAALYLGEEREWSYQVVQKTVCACGEKVSNSVGRHSCGAVINIDRAIAFGQISAEEGKRLKKLRGEYEKKEAAEAKKPATAKDVPAGGFADGTDDYQDPADEVLAGKDATEK